jgi:hypothetical protein
VRLENQHFEDVYNDEDEVNLDEDFGGVLVGLLIQQPACLD